MQFVGDLLRMNAASRGDDVALVVVEPGWPAEVDDESYRLHRQTISWLEFNERANRVANYLNGLGMGPGTKVGLLLRNCLDWLPIYFGILKSGAVAVPMNYRYTTDELVDGAASVDLDALVFGPYCASRVVDGAAGLVGIRSFMFVGGRDDCPGFAVNLSEALETADTAEPAFRCGAEDDAAIYFSSGTTGKPKPVVYTQETLAQACLRELANHGQTRRDCFVLIPPLYHVGAKLHWMANLLVGAPAVLLLGFSARTFIEVMARERATIAFLVLPWAQDLLAALDSGAIRAEDYRLTDWRLLHLGAQYIPPQVVRRLQAHLPGLSFDVTYGLTESGGPGCLHLSAAHLEKLGSVGTPARGWRARVVDDHERPLNAGAVGELHVSGPGMMRCYYKDPESTERTLHDGWLRTGDMAYRDQDGYVFVVGRKRDVVISGGENIWCVPIEEVLRRNGAVKDVAVFGAPDERMGEVVVALVELQGGRDCSEQELIDWCEPLPCYERPRQIRFGAVPRNALGKVDREAAKRSFTAQLGQA